MTESPLGLYSGMKTLEAVHEGFVLQRLVEGTREIA